MHRLSWECDSLTRNARSRGHYFDSVSAVANEKHLSIEFSRAG